MSTYQWADGNNNAAGLTDLSPQPSTFNIHYPLRVYGGDGTPKNKGSAFAILRYHKELTETQYNSLLTQLGLSSALFNPGTVKLIGEDRTTWANYNGTVIKPHNPTYERGFYRDVEFIINELVAL